MPPRHGLSEFKFNIVFGRTHQRRERGFELSGINGVNNVHALRKDRIHSALKFAGETYSESITSKYSQSEV